MEVVNPMSEELRDLVDFMKRTGVSQAAEGFSGMIGTAVKVSPPRVRLVPMEQVSHLLGGPENEAVGIYLRAQGDIPGQMMLVLAYPQALDLVDLILGQAPGSTSTLGAMERSVLGELGNLTGSFFLNAMAAFSGFSVRPSPPAVMVDMVGAILDVVVATHGANSNLLMLQVTFLSEEREVEADFWVIPDTQTPRIFSKRKAAGHGG
jgi:chemotaxis protein CheC